MTAPSPPEGTDLAIQGTKILFPMDLIQIHSIQDRLQKMEVLISWMTSIDLWISHTVFCAIFVTLHCGGSNHIWFLRRVEVCV